MFLVVIGILSLILAFESPPMSRVHDPGWVLLAVSLATLAPGAAALFVARRSLSLLDRNPADPGIGQFYFNRGTSVVHGMLGGAHAGALCVTDWMKLTEQAPLVGDWPLIPGLLTCVPFLLSILIVWIASYPVDRAIRQIALEAQLFRGKPVQPVWRMGKYLLFNFRHQVLFILVPMLLILGARDLILQYEDALNSLMRKLLGQPSSAAEYPFLPDVLLGAASVAVALIAPLILRHVWQTSPLPIGPLRDRLESLCKQLRMRYREILVWQSGGMIVNAAVMGVIAPLRYVLITDTMIEQMPDAKIEAVFGHEAGHVKRHHIAFFLLFALISGCLITIVSIRTRQLGPTTHQIATALLGGVLCFKWFVLFGWISRHFERQADLFGVRTLTLAGVECQAEHCSVHTHDASPPAPRDVGRTYFCRTAAHLFGDTLNEVALLNGITPESRSWRHGSIALRSRIVQKYALDPREAARFERRVRNIKLGIVLAAVVGSLWAGWDMKLWALLGIAT